MEKQYQFKSGIFSGPRAGLRLWVLAAAVCLAGTAAALEPPIVDIERLHSPRFTADGAYLVCTVRVTNPNSRSLRVTGSAIELELAGTPAATGSLRGPVDLPANSMTNVDIDVAVTQMGAVTWLPMFLAVLEFTVPYRIRGTVSVAAADVGTVPFDERGEVAMTRNGLVVRPRS